MDFTTSQSTYRVYSSIYYLMTWLLWWDYFCLFFNSPSKCHGTKYQIRWQTDHSHKRRTQFPVTVVESHLCLFITANHTPDSTLSGYQQVLVRKPLLSTTISPAGVPKWKFTRNRSVNYSNNLVFFVQTCYTGNLTFVKNVPPPSTKQWLERKKDTMTHVCI